MAKVGEGALWVGDKEGTFGLEGDTLEVVEFAGATLLVGEATGGTLLAGEATGETLLAGEETGETLLTGEVARMGEVVPGVISKWTFFALEAETEGELGLLTGAEAEGGDIFIGEVIFVGEDNFDGLFNLVGDVAERPASS